VPLNIVLQYQNSAPPSFQNAMQSAANILDSLIVNNITVYIQVTYDTSLGTSAEGGDLNGNAVSYSTLRNALAANATSSADQTFVNSLPTTSSISGVDGSGSAVAKSSFYVPSAIEKGLGLISATASAADGAVFMGSQIANSLLVGVALHEITHAMGREPGVGPFDLFRYTSSGQYLFSSSATAPAAHFSINGGSTDLADFGQTSDSSDFLNSGVQGSTDPFNEFYSSHTQQTLTAVDKELMDVLGFSTTSNGVVVSGTSSQALQGGAAVTLLNGTPTVTDANSTTLSSATIKVANGSGSAVTGDELYINGQQSGTVNGVAVSWNDSTKVLTLSGSATISTYQTLLREVSYKDAGTDSASGSHPQRTVTWTVNDGTNSYNTSSQVTIDRPPVANNDVATDAAGATLSIAAAAGVLSNDRDLDSDTLMVTGVSDAIHGSGAVGQSLPGVFGHLTLNSDGSYTYTADIAAAINSASSGSHPQDSFTYTVSDGNGGTASATFTVTIDPLAVVNPPPPAPNPAPPSGTTADMILRRPSDGGYVIYDLGNKAILSWDSLVQVGTDWAFVTLGGFNGGDTSDMLLRNSNTGGFQVYNIANNNITGSAFLGAVGLDWQASGFGDFSSLGETDMILRNANTGGLQLYDIRNNQIAGSAFMGTVGLNWQTAGVSNHGSESDLVLRNTGTGGLQIYNINNNQISDTAFLGTVGLDWQPSGFGNFSSRNEGDMLLRNVNTGALMLYDIAHNQITGTFFLGNIGLAWQFAGVAAIDGPGTSDLVLRNVNTGAFQVYNIANNQITETASLGQVGLEWQLGGFAPFSTTGSSMNVAQDSTSQLVQAMAGFGGSSGAGGSLNTIPLGADTSQQTFLTAPHA
jgi:VCBS repeat-containing protein